MNLHGYKCIHGTMTYNLGGEKVSDEITAYAPLDSSVIVKIKLLQSSGRDVLRAFGATGGSIKMRLDGSNKPLSIFEHIQDWGYQNINWGEQITGIFWVDLGNQNIAPKSSLSG